MYAMMTQWQADESQYETLRTKLQTEIAPRVQRAPGFIEGYFVWDHATGKAYDLILFETEEQARAEKTTVEQLPQPDAPVRFELARVVEVAAHAKGAVATNA